MDSHRESCQRQHRVLGHFFAVQAWLRGLDCIALERQNLEVFLGLKRFKSQRVQWLKEDFKPWFPFQVSYNRTGHESSLHLLFLARLPISKWLSDESMTTQERISALPKEAPRAEILSTPPRGRTYLAERDVVQYLAVLDSGLSAPEALTDVPRSTTP